MLSRSICDLAGEPVLWKGISVSLLWVCKMTDDQFGQLMMGQSYRNTGMGHLNLEGDLKDE
jgi:hypothetical protein